MDTPLALVTDETVEQKPEGRSWRELPVTEDGLSPRRVGPYRTKADTRDVLEDFMADVRLELFMNLLNDTSGTPQVLVVEGVPTLKGRRP